MRQAMKCLLLSMCALLLALVLAPNTGAVWAQDNPQKPRPTDTPPPEPARMLEFNPEDIRERARARVEQRDIQDTLPGEMTTPDPPGWLRAVMEFIGTVLVFIIQLWWLFAGLLVVLLIAIFAAMFSGLNFRRRDRKLNNKQGGDTQSDEDTAPLWSRDALGEADQLAAQERYAEAVHILLLGSFGTLQEQRLAHLTDDLTSREILAQLSLPEGPQDALTLLIGTVEISYFGGRDVQKDHFDACRSAFLRFAEPESGAS